jgi:hypothetical protein
MYNAGRGRFLSLITCHVVLSCLCSPIRPRYHLACAVMNNTLFPRCLPPSMMVIVHILERASSDGSACRCHCTRQLQPVPAGDLWDGIRSVSYREGRWASGDLLIVDSELSHCRFRAQSQHQLTYDDACRRHCRCQLQPVSGRDLWDWIRSGCTGDSFSLPESPTLSALLPC